MLLRIVMKSIFFILGIVIGIILVYNVPHHHSQHELTAIENTCEPVLQPYLSLD